MKKVLLLVCAALSTILVNAQEKKYYPTVVLSEEMIKAKLQSAKVNGEDNAEIQSLKERLYAKLEEQQKEIKLHGSLVAKTLPPSVTSTGCVNPGFEDGTTNGWVLEVGDNSGAASLPCPTCFTGPGGVYAVTNSTYTDPNSTSCSCSNTSNCSNPPCTNGIDNYGGFPVTIGLHSLLINNTTCGNKMEKASYSFVVDNTNNSYTFSYAVVIQNGNTAGNSHAPGTQPYFHVDVTDNTTGSVIPCTQFDVEAPTSGNLNGFSHSTLDNNVYYKAWTSVTLDLTAAMTHSVTVSFTVSDCLYSGHFGYAYIDGACNQINTSNVAGICNGTNANLCGPPGYLSYSWTGPVSGSSQCLSTSTAGSYTLNLTSASACPPPVMHYSVTVAPAPTASFTINNPSCSLTINATDASSVSGGGTISNWSWDFGDGQTATSTTAGNTQAHTYTNTGTYTVAMTCTTSAGCVATYTLPVTITSLSVTATSSSVTCNGASTGSATVTATGGSGSFTYAWSPSGGTGNIASGLSAGSYSCVVSDGGSCNYTATVNVTQATPITSTKSITDAYCNLPDGGVTVTPSGGAGGYTYSWSGPGGAGGNTGTLSGVTAGVYTLTVHDSNNCTYTTTATINNLAGDSILSITTASVSCYNGTNGTANATTSGTGITYTWSPAGGNSSSASGLSPNTYTLYITDSHGCTDNASAIVGNATPVTATSTITATPCGGSLGSATVTPSGGTGPYTYTWSPAPASGNANNVQNLTSGGYNCVITDSHSCTYTTSIIITTTSGPTVTAVQTASVTCNGLSNGSASVTTISGGTAPYSYSWLPGPVSTTNTALGVPANTYSVIVTDNTGCIGLDTVTVYQPAPFSLPVVTGTVSCNNLNSTISPTLTTDGSAAVNGSGGTGAWTYTWTNSNNQVVSNSSSTGPILPVGTYTCNILDANGCATHTVAVITSPPKLTAAVTTSSVSCNPANTGNSSNGSTAALASGGTPLYQYAWSPGIGGAPTYTNSSYGGLTAGTYSLHLVDTKGCIFDSTVMITGPLAVTVTGTVSPILCNNLKGSATVTPSPVDSYTYAWTPSGGSSNIATNLTGSTGAGTGYTCTVTNPNGCKAYYTMSLTKPSQMSVAITPATNPTCAGGANGTLHANATNGTPYTVGSAYTYTWAPGGMNTATISGLPSGSYTVTVQDSNHCQVIKTKTITAPEPVDTLQATGTLCSTDPQVTLSAPTGGAAPDDITGYQWYSGTTLITGANSSTYSANQSTVHNYSVNWIYHGCIHTTKTIVENILPDLGTLPQTNIFTPNDDKKNDEFYPFSTINSIALPSYSIVNSMLKSYNLVVYDRWGKKMYETSDIMKPWEGKTTSGHDAPDGTYYWIVNYQSHCNNGEGIKKIKGFVQLLR